MQAARHHFEAPFGNCCRVLLTKLSSMSTPDWLGLLAHPEHPLGSELWTSQVGPVPWLAAPRVRGACC